MNNKIVAIMAIIVLSVGISSAYAFEQNYAFMRDNFYLPSPEIVQYELTEDGQTVRISWNELSYDSENIGETIEPEKYFIMGSFGAYEIISSDDSRFVVDDD